MVSRVLSLPHGAWQDCQEALFPPGGGEGFLFGLARPCRSHQGIRYVTEVLEKALPEAYAQQSPAFLGLTDQTSSRCNRIAAAAATCGLVPIHVHSHPPGIEHFSAHDDRQEKELHRWLVSQGQPFLLSVLAPHGASLQARLWMNDRALPIPLRIGLETFSGPAPHLPALERQKVFGDTFRASAASLRVAIVGLGGVGMPVAEQLARSGFRDFLLVDHDVVEESNLNRLPSLKRRDVGRHKVDVARRIIRTACNSLGVTASVTCLKQDIYLAPRRVKQAVGKCDIVLALTDDEISRITCLQVALEAGAHYLQAGVRIGIGADNRIDTVAVEVTGAESRRYCPLCSGRLSTAQASVDARRYVGGEVLERAKAEGYIPEEPAPSIMSLNAMAAGALVLEVQKRAAGLPCVDIWQFDALRGTQIFEERIDSRLSAQCHVCRRGV